MYGDHYRFIIPQLTIDLCLASNKYLAVSNFVNDINKFSRYAQSFSVDYLFWNVKTYRCHELLTFYHGHALKSQLTHQQASILLHGRLVRDDNGGHPRHRGPHQRGARETATRGGGARHAR